jgi:hemerythrin-like metal-binding protein
MIPDKQSLITGDATIDMEHNQILSTLNRLQEPSLSKVQRISICEKLLYYINEHIVLEEHLMNIYDYPGKYEHADNHLRVQKEFLKFLSSFIRGHEVAISSVYDTFVFHIIDFDMPMAVYLKDKKEQEEL